MAKNFRLKEPIELDSDQKSLGGMMSSDGTSGILVRLPDVSELDNLPASGEITFHFCRRRVSLDDRQDGDSVLSADVTLCKILAIKPDPKGDLEEGDETDSTDGLIDKLFAESQDKPDDSE